MIKDNINFMKVLIILSPVKAFHEYNIRLFLMPQNVVL